MDSYRKVISTLDDTINTTINRLDAQANEWRDLAWSTLPSAKVDYLMQGKADGQVAEAFLKVDFNRVGSELTPYEFWVKIDKAAMSTYNNIAPKLKFYDTHEQHWDSLSITMIHANFVYSISDLKQCDIDTLVVKRAAAAIAMKVQDLTITSPEKYFAANIITGASANLIFNMGWESANKECMGFKSVATLLS